MSEQIRKNLNGISAIAAIAAACLGSYLLGLQSTPVERVTPPSLSITPTIPEPVDINRPGTIAIRPDLFRSQFEPR